MKTLLVIGAVFCILSVAFCLEIKQEGDSSDISQLQNTDAELTKRFLRLDDYEPEYEENDLEEESEEISDEIGDDDYDSMNEDEEESDSEESETGLEMRGIYGRSVQSYNSDFEEDEREDDESEDDEFEDGDSDDEEDNDEDDDDDSDDDSDDEDDDSDDDSDDDEDSDLEESETEVEIRRIYGRSARGDEEDDTEEDGYEVDGYEEGEFEEDDLEYSEEEDDDSENDEEDSDSDESDTELESDRIRELYSRSAHDYDTEEYGDDGFEGSDYTEDDDDSEEDDESIDEDDDDSEDEEESDMEESEGEQENRQRRSNKDCECSEKDLLKKRLEKRIHKLEFRSRILKFRPLGSMSRKRIQKQIDAAKAKLAALEQEEKKAKRTDEASEVEETGEDPDGKDDVAEEEVGEGEETEARYKKRRHTLRRRRDTHRDADEISKRDCSQSKSVSVPKLAAQTVKLEKEIQRKIAKKLEQRIEKEVSENVEDGVLQKEVETAIENDIEKKVQKKLKQETGDLPHKVKVLEKNFKELKHQLENSPWTTFQRLLMEQAKQSGEEGNGLTESDFERLKQMHKMTPAERKAFMKSMKNKVTLSEKKVDQENGSEIQEKEEEDEDQIIRKQHPKKKTQLRKKAGMKLQKNKKKQPKKVVGKKNQLKKKVGKKVQDRKKGHKKKGLQRKKGNLKGKGRPKKRKGGLRRGKGGPRRGKGGLRRGKGGLRRGKKGPKGKKRMPKKGKKGQRKRGPKRGPKRGRKIGQRKRGPKRGRKIGQRKRGPKRGPKRGRKIGQRKGVRHQKKQQPQVPSDKELQRKKRDLSSTGEWYSEEGNGEVPTVSQRNDLGQSRMSGIKTNSVKYQLPSKAVDGPDLWKPVRQQQPVQTLHPLEWSRDHSEFLQSNQPGPRSRRSSDCPVVPEGAKPYTFPELERKSDPVEESTREDATGTAVDECAKCEERVGEEVCGSNGKTYNSLCHAINCGHLKEMDITFGSCEDRDPCSRHQCSSSETCAAMTYGPCLTIYTADGRKLPCRQYICVAKEDCGHMEYSEVCGVDGKTYPTLCHLQQSGVKLAYSGHCRAKLCTGTVCGRDGVTYPSSCHARAHNVRVDYKGTCFAEDLEDNVRGCSEVRATGLCPPTSCPDAVIPEGACCPVCGGGVEVKPDAAQLAELAKDWPEINHLYMVENFLRRLVPPETAAQCDVSLTLADTGAISLMLEAVQQQHSATCQAAAMDVVEKINRPAAGAAGAVKPLARTARLLGTLGGNMIENSIQAQVDVVTSDIEKMKSGASNKMAGAYNDNMKNLESYDDMDSGCGTVLASLTAVLVTITVAISVP